MEVSSEYAVQMHGIVKRFGAFTALDGVDLDVRKQTVHAILGENTCNNSGKSCGRAGTLHTASTKERDQKTGDDGGIEALLRADAGGKSQRDGEGQGDDGNNYAGNNILKKLLFCIAFPDGEKHGL